MVGIGGMGTTELLIILAIMLLLFGSKRLPELAKALGESVRVFRETQSTKRGKGGKKEIK
ncbi:MAG: twin-arginine translocase TatA/TatE family subunit [Candidatus Altiarchaeales archaeon]|nr:MAG: twin-arginine translocase TatA/TatE family subunit [Candidatus Altiarchaeales archaeon]RLI94989.1 MAG: twin-arginine translocase TatA/TatE family subunit [Candidatus Altiarchaeales archaeon]HDO82722.1 twin-arginine translocase TatA/TatE family subunit [Candidatus Altiarchaeales archaeon]HEX55371.1 twin-arginine translocase TatA/TatE family subunit [Candidatus Altiarchaeales archaeon]